MLCNRSFRQHRPQFFINTPLAHRYALSLPQWVHSVQHGGGAWRRLRTLGANCPHAQEKNIAGGDASDHTEHTADSIGFGDAAVHPATYAVSILVRNTIHTVMIKKKLFLFL